MIIGLTGGIGTGKSTVASVLQDLGLYLIDVDQVYHALLKPGSSLLQEIKVEFGLEYFYPDGTLNRRLLGQEVFANPPLLRTLERITHPAINTEVSALVAKARHHGKDTVLDHPLLFELEMESLVDEVWVVTAPRCIQMARICERNRINRQEAEKRIKAQLPLEYKIARADLVIENNGDFNDLKRKIIKVWKERISCSPK